MKHPLWVLTQQEKNNDGADNYTCQYLKSINDDDWVASLYKAVEYRCFFGIMTVLETVREEQNMTKIGLKGDYIIYLERPSLKKFIFLILADTNYYDAKSYDTFDQCLERMTRQGLDKQFDRGKGLIFAKTARDRAIPAIQCWLIIGKRLRVVRDIRLLIAKRLWANKHTWVT